MKPANELTLDQQRDVFIRNKFVAMPVAGAIAWTLVGICGTLFGTYWSSMCLFGLTGSIFYLGLFIARFTGEDLLGRTRPSNLFDRIFLMSVFQAFLVFSIAIPFFLVERTSLPLSVGILSGLMWIPFSLIINHWVGYFHTISRTLLIVVLWYAFPELRFVLIPLAIVAVYVITIATLLKRHQKVTAKHAMEIS
ncbi:MAG: hypothetical protein AB8B55_04735 [Mariniblastus sp.]